MTMTTCWRHIDADITR